MDCFPIRRIKISTTERFAHQRFIEVFEIGTNDGDSRKKGTREGQYYWRGAFLDYDIAFKVANNLETLSRFGTARPAHCRNSFLRHQSAIGRSPNLRSSGMALPRRPAMYLMSLI